MHSIVEVTFAVKERTGSCGSMGSESGKNLWILLKGKVYSRIEWVIYKIHSCWVPRFFGYAGTDRLLTISPWAGILAIQSQLFLSQEH